MTYVDPNESFKTLKMNHWLCWQEDWDQVKGEKTKWWWERRKKLTSNYDDNAMLTVGCYHI